MSRPHKLRQQARISYFEPEEPSLDEYVYCDECKDFVFEYCSVHGALLVIPDDKVPTKPQYPSFVPRAALTIPRMFLHLAPSIIPGAGLGVFSTLTLPRGVRFGPYRGLRTNHVDSMYCWQIYNQNNKPSHVVDAADGHNSNWMRYVNCARHWREQNLVAFQYQGQLYYRTIKIIPRFTELMVFYGSEFANKLGVDLRNYNAPPGYAAKYGAPVAKKTKMNINGQKKSDELNNENTFTDKTKEKPSKVTKQVASKSSKTCKANMSQPNVKLKSKVCKKHQNDKAKDFIPFTKREKVKINAKTKVSIEIAETTININETKGNYNYVNKPVSIINKDQISNNSQSNGNINKKSFILNSIKTMYTCNTCNYNFNNKNSLKGHIRSHSLQLPFKCDVCQSSFHNLGTLKIHIRTHTGEKPYECGICHKRFTRLGDLRTHIRIHTGEQPYECDICHKRFIRLGHLRTHIRIHTGEKPYKCEICQKCFNQLGSLKIHIRIHTGEKLYECEICHKRFIQLGYLKTHIRIHTGEKPYKCEICQKCFNQLGSLKRHIRIHTSEKP